MYRQKQLKDSKVARVKAARETRESMRKVLCSHCRWRPLPPEAWRWRPALERKCQRDLSQQLVKRNPYCWKGSW